jgi:threonyl-tRNA synthetase
MLESSEIRVDIDDRDTTLGNKIREAEVNWVPYIAVVGDREKENETVSVRIRSSRERVTISTDSLIEMVDKELEGTPRLPLNMPILISLRPKFI